MSNQEWWKAGLAVALMAAVLFIFMGPVLRSPESYVFSADGDGLQTYYQSIYHVKYDSTAMHQQSMNAPFGESIFFTGGQPLLSNIIRGMAGETCNASTVIAWTNLLMLLSPLLCVLFLYLIFRRYELPWYYAIFAAVGITMLTQQWDRFLGHYPLAYLYAVPGVLWGLMRWSDMPSWYRTAWNAFYVLVLASFHLYYLFFFAAIACAFWMTHFPWRASSWRQRSMTTAQIAAQVLIPFLALQWFISSTSDVVDRTSIPWGFSVYRSYWQSYVWPSGMWYEKAFAFLRGKNPLEWEGMSYIGLGAIVLLLAMPWRWIQRKKVLPSLQQDRFLVALWISVVICVLLSFTFPFNLGLESLLYKLGAVQQFRGIGRFAWVAFYPLLVALMIYWFGRRGDWTIRLHGWMCLVLIFLFMDGVQRISGVSERLSQPRGALFEEELVPIPTTEYSALLPLPCFQIGSENIGMDAPGEWKAACYDLSVKTGLPMIASSMSRTSISQTFQNAALIQPLFEFPDVIHTWQSKDQRPFLLMIDPRRDYPQHEQLLIDCSDSVGAWKGYTFRRLPWDAWSEIHQITCDQQQSANSRAYYQGKFMDIKNCLVFSDWNREFEFSRSWTRLDEVNIPSEWVGDSVVVQFEVEDFQHDLFPRTFVETVQMNGEELVRYESEMMGKRYIYSNHGVANIQYPTRIRVGTKSIRLSAENKLIQGQKMRMHHLVLFQVGED